MNKTTAILAAAAAAFLLASGPSFAAAAEPQTKQCYRHLHKVPHPVRVRCPKAKVQMPNAPVPSEKAQKQPAQQPPKGQNP